VKVMISKKAIKCLVAGTALLVSYSASAAWPDRPLTIVAPYAPGGNADVLARLIGKAVGERLGQTVIVENRPGAGGMVGSAYVAHAKPDGYTFLLGSIANTLYPYFYKKVPYDVKSSLQPVSQVVSIPNLVAVAPKSKFKNLQEIIAEAKSHPGTVSCATTGVGTSTYLSCELIKLRLGVNITDVPYKGGIPAITDVIGGQVNFVIANEALPFIKDGRLRGIAVTSEKPTSLAPSITPVSSMIKGFNVVSWYGIFAPSHTPKQITEKLAHEVAEALKSKEVLDRLTVLGATPVSSTPAEFKKYFDSELEGWGKITKEMNVTPS